MCGINPLNVLLGMVIVFVVLYVLIYVLSRKKRKSGKYTNYYYLDKDLENKRNQKLDDKHSKPYEPEHNKDISQYHESDFDDEKYMNNEILDERMKENHKLWVNNMKPFNQSSTVRHDTFEPENYISRYGINSFLKKPVAISNPTQLSGHIDADEYSRLGQKNNRECPF